MDFEQRDSGLIVPQKTDEKTASEPIGGILQRKEDREKVRKAICDLIDAVGLKSGCSGMSDQGRYATDGWQAYLLLSGLVYNASNTMLGELVGWEEKT